MLTNPSLDNRCNASRTRVRVAVGCSRMMSASTRRWPGTKLPRRMRSRIQSTMSLTLQAVRLGRWTVIWNGASVGLGCHGRQYDRYFGQQSTGIDRVMELIFTGDLILDEPEPDHWLGGIAPALRSADLTIGHLEVPHTTHVAASRDDVPAPGCGPCPSARAGASRHRCGEPWPAITLPTWVKSASPIRFAVSLARALHIPAPARR